MYTAQQQNNLMQQTKQLLQLLQKENNLLFEVNELREVLRFHEYQYYVLSQNLITDFEYDALYKALVKLEAANPQLIVPNSPTQRVGSNLVGDFAKAQHLVPMLSLDNSYNADDLFDFDRKVKEAVNNEAIAYSVEPKFDGASISLMYENDFLVRATTRGDGVMGDDITTNIKQIKSIPLKANFSSYGIHQIEIRGEVIITKDNFNKYNESLAEKGLPLVANPRNTASGSLRIKDAKEVARRNLDAFLYHVGYVVYDDNKNALTSHEEQLNMLWQCGFKTPNQYKKTLPTINEVINYINEFENFRDDLPYEIDGMVVKVNSLLLQDKLGITSHHPRWAVAYKFKARQAITQLLHIEYQVGRTGAVTPVAKLQPVPIGGVTVSSISVHNEEYIAEKNLMIGDTVVIERAGDVIPQIVKSLTDKRTGNEQPIVFPKNCPVCKSHLHKEEGEAVWRCINIECEAQVVEKICHFVSKDALDIKSLGEANVKKFYQLGLLKDVPGIYTISYPSLATLEGFGSKSIENLQQAIEKSKQQPLHRLIYGLGIRYVGETTAKTLANAVSDIIELKNFSIEQLQQLDDVGVKVAASIFAFFDNQQNIEIVQQLKQLGVNTANDKMQTTEGSLQGKTFLFTGTLNKLKRSDAEALAEQQGGKILSGVSAKLNYLVVGDDAGSKLEKAKKISTIHILTEDEFLELVK